MLNTDRKIATLTLPLCDNDGQRLMQVHQLVRNELLDAFGGYTQSLVTGAWKDADGTVYTDDSLKYEIAMSAGAGDGKQLVKIAGMACLAGKQKCVMVQLAAGNVVFVEENGSMS